MAPWFRLLKSLFNVIGPRMISFKYGPYPQEMVDKANEELDNFSKILESRGIRVDRPTPIDFSQAVQTPDWKQATMFGCCPSRDLLLTVGNEILESTMSYRSRWFEYLCYRPLFEQYFRDDPNFRFEAAPKPRLVEESYKKKDWWSEWNSLSEAEQWERAEKGDWIISEKEPLFDAADVVRYGRDLFVQKSMVTNNAGVDWLRRHFPIIESIKSDAENYCHGIWTHPGSCSPGLAVMNPERQFLDRGARTTRRMTGNCASPEALLKREPYDFCSWWLSMNTLCSIRAICVKPVSPTMELFDKYGFEVVPVPFYKVAAFEWTLLYGMGTGKDPEITSEADWVSRIPRPSIFCIDFPR
jgi:glycine amidinotransferase